MDPDPTDIPADIRERFFTAVFCQNIDERRLHDILPVHTPGIIE